MKQNFNKRIIVFQKRDMDFYEYYLDDEIRPAIIFLHDAMGIGNYLFETGMELAKKGFHIFIPDLYSHVGQVSYCLPFLFNFAIRNNEEKENEKLNEMHEIVHYVKSQKLVMKNKIGIIGQCLTGGFILHMALREEIKAPVVFHHSFGLKGSGVEEEVALKIDKKVQGHFSYFDPLCPSNRVDQLQKQLGHNLIRYEYKLPHGIPHLFHTTADGKLAFERMQNFFLDELIKK